VRYDGQDLSLSAAAKLALQKLATIWTSVQGSLFGCSMKRPWRKFGRRKRTRVSRRANETGQADRFFQLLKESRSAFLHASQVAHNRAQRLPAGPEGWKAYSARNGAALAKLRGVHFYSKFDNRSGARADFLVTLTRFSDAEDSGNM